MTKIFLVDDEPLVLIGMQGMLNWAELGYTVVGTARNGAEALKAIGETYPDIVVSDIRMPVMDGFTLAESCHKDGSALPVFIMLTSYEEFDYVKRSMRLGVVDYLVKIDLTAESLTAALDKARAADAHKTYISRILQKEDGVRFYLYEGKLPDTEKLKKMLDEYQGKIKYAGSKEPYLLYMMQKDKKKAVSRNMYRMPSKNMIKKEKKLTADEIFNIVESVIKSIGGLYDKK